MDTIGTRLRKFGSEHFSSLTEFAREMGMGMSSLSGYLHDRREPGTGVLLRLQKLGCSIDWLLNGEVKISSVVNSYPVYLGVGSSEKIDTVYYPFHKSVGMYCLYVCDNKIITKKKLPYEVLLIDTDRLIKEEDCIVIKTTDGKGYYKKLAMLNSKQMVVMPVFGGGKPYIFNLTEVVSFHKVVSKLIRYE